MTAARPVGGMRPSVKLRITMSLDAAGLVDSQDVDTVPDIRINAVVGGEASRPLLHDARAIRLCY